MHASSPASMFNMSVPLMTTVKIPNVPPPPPWYVQLIPELILLAGVASIATVLYKRWLKLLLSRLVKPRLVKAVISALGGLTLGLSYYLHSIDHQVFVPMQGPCSPPSVSCFAGTNYPVQLAPQPPWYANLWPEALALGITLLLLPWVRVMWSRKGAVLLSAVSAVLIAIGIYSFTIDKPVVLRLAVKDVEVTPQHEHEGESSEGHRH